ncbi:MAG: T9SS type A sorting domain-containing protein, partial [candidate division WOR-3 bacterium]|nr:T9SS type A sorting domain-containing protein [candidate division WOR-3 bacterium]
RKRARWLKMRGIEKDFSPIKPDSLNVRCVGRWSYGPSWEITGKIIANNTYLFLSRGSGVSVLKFIPPDSIELLSDINASGLVMEAIVKDTLLFLGCYNFGIEIYNISNLTNPRRVNWIITSQNNFFIKDTFLYLISEDTFKIYNISNPLNPILLGQVRDSGYSIYVSGNYAYLGDRWGLYILDVSNPRVPRRISSWGTHIEAVWVKENYCYLTTGSEGGNRFYVLDVSNPRNPYELGYLDNMAGRYDIYVIDYFVYLPNFDIIDVSIPNFPTRISGCGLPGWKEAVWTNNPFGYSFVACYYEGLAIVNINDPTNPYLQKRSILRASDSYKIIVKENIGYLANNLCGIKILDLSDISLPKEIGSYDTLGWDPSLYSLAIEDSFAYLHWPLPGQPYYFHSVNISDPRNLIPYGYAPLLNGMRDIAIRDNYAYVAEDYYFEIFNVANPRQPYLVGRCNSLDMTGGLCLKDTFAYIASSFGWAIINIANPINPTMINTINMYSSWGISVVDSFAYLFCGYLRDTLSIWNIINPYNPYKVSSIYIRSTGYDVVVNNGLAYVGSRLGLLIIDVSDPLTPREIGFYNTPYYVRRVFYHHPYIYCACFSAGVIILEYLLPAIKEIYSQSKMSKIKIFPNPFIKNEINDININKIVIYNILGKEVMRNKLDLRNLKKGIYFICLLDEKEKLNKKIIKIRR